MYGINKRKEQILNTHLLQHPVQPWTLGVKRTASVLYLMLSSFHIVHQTPEELDHHSESCTKKDQLTV